MAVNPINISGSIDINSIVDKLMQVERQPLLRLQQKEVSYKAKISAYGVLLSKLGELKNTLAELKGSNLMGMKASVSNTDFLSAEALDSASEGTYHIQIKNVATSQSIYSVAFSSETEEVADLSTFSSQRIQIQVGSNTPITVTVDSTNNTLSGIRDAINSADSDVRATVINDGNGYRLVLSSKLTGASNRITVKVDEDNNGVFEEPSETDLTGLSKLAFNPTYDSDGNVTGGISNMIQSQAAVDAVLKIDGLEVTRPSNEINDLIPGVNLEIKKGDGFSSTIVLTVTEDSEKLKTKLNSFVSAYNQLVNTIKDLKGSNEKKGALSGDSVLMGLENSLRSITTTNYGGKTLNLFGLTHDKNGVLSLDTSRLDTSLDNSKTDVIATINQMASSLETAISDYINTAIPVRKNGLEQSIKWIQKKEDDLSRRLELTEIALRQKFINLDKLLNQLEGVSNQLVQQMDKISSLGGKK
ncbi:MAG: flagellar hook-associated protein 2 [Deltaproteobacteria bacterium]|jgi:flagellar hook-associated protein 2|nr:MAG: flagellar hook-associated protein 2 [Deltaproteobacteria bacterium]